MLFTIADESNEVDLPIVAKSDGEPITTGTVNFYLKALSGTNKGKWYKGSTAAWGAAIEIAGAATHDVDGHWYLELVSAVWTKGVRYKLIARESGDLHIAVERSILCVDITDLKGIAWELMQSKA